MRSVSEMKQFIRGITFLILLGLVVIANGCLEEHVIEIVLKDETCASFPENHDNENFVTPDTVDYGKEIEKILRDNEISRSDIAYAFLVSASYSVTEFEHTHDWDISGYVTVERGDIVDGPDTLLNYTDQSVEEALDVHIQADLNDKGVAIIDRALADFINGMNPILIITVNNGNVDIDPTPADPIVFDWEACIVIQVITQQELEKFQVF